MPVTKKRQWEWSPGAGSHLARIFDAIDEDVDNAHVLIDLKQETLVSGENIKTINNMSLLGSGNLTISGVGDNVITVEFNHNSTFPLSVGTIEAERFCYLCMIEIPTSFDGSTQISVGDGTDTERFQSGSDNVSNISAIYETKPNVSLVSETEVYVYLSGTPTSGQGRATLCFG